jgi:hypothetical protein
MSRTIEPSSSFPGWQKVQHYRADGSLSRARWIPIGDHVEPDETATRTVRERPSWAHPTAVAEAGGASAVAAKARARTQATKDAALKAARDRARELDRKRRARGLAAREAAAAARVGR